MIDFFVSMTFMAVAFIPSSFIAARMMRKIKQKWYADIFLIEVVLVISLITFLPIAHFGILDKDITMDLFMGFWLGSLIGGIQKRDREKQAMN
ncbi:hypothetical protein [Candidatus Albibeggiatoa sp. nov. NOAA]|uniref:hypothetical protein n=1 Tax=Candidatus Albibeggiatoa sp. nov. NOAA TaxID=3162724 RepID=UPI0032FD8D2C|nr:hypothetical protein [Thiotrichaceae bacterium]